MTLLPLRGNDADSYAFRPFGGRSARALWAKQAGRNIMCQRGYAPLWGRKETEGEPLCYICLSLPAPKGAVCAVVGFGPSPLGTERKQRVPLPFGDAEEAHSRLYMPKGPSLSLGTESPLGIYSGTLFCLKGAYIAFAPSFSIYYVPLALPRGRLASSHFVFGFASRLAGDEEKERSGPKGAQRGYAGRDGNA